MKTTLLDNMCETYAGIVCFFGTDDRITYVNSQFAGTLGYQYSELMGMNIFELINPDDKTEFTNNTYVKTNHPAMTIRLHHANGAHIYVSVQAFRFADQFMIIGERMQRNFRSFNYDVDHEEVLQITNDMDLDVDDIRDVVEDHFESIRLALDNLPIDFWVKDKHHRYLYMNKIMLKRTNIGNNAYLNKNDFEIFEKEVANDFITSDMQAIKAKKKTQYTFEAKVDRFVKWTEVSKVPVFNKKDEYIGMIGCALDISQTKLLEQQLKHENKLMLKIIQSIYDMACIINPKGIIEHTISKLDADLTILRGQQYSTAFADQPKLVHAIHQAFVGNDYHITIPLLGHSMDLNITPLIIEESQSPSILIVGKKGA